MGFRNRVAAMLGPVPEPAPMRRPFRLNDGRQIEMHGAREWHGTRDNVHPASISLAGQHNPADRNAFFPVGASRGTLTPRRNAWTSRYYNGQRHLFYTADGRWVMQDGAGAGQVLREHAIQYFYENDIEPPRDLFPEFFADDPAPGAGK